ncbi:MULTISPECIES: hypothetical protein [Actinomycetes]|uniref:hypothetical protein n=1 Tax=Actinomycetes TaxID=1760 RepID=UPI0002EDBD89|nr:MULTISPECIES: hypothetical protein [Actinomycetes]
MFRTHGGSWLLGDDGWLELDGPDELDGACVGPVGPVVSGRSLDDGRAGAESAGRSGALLSSPNGFTFALREGASPTVTVPSSDSVPVGVGGLVSSTPPAPPVRSGISITRISVIREAPSFAVVPYETSMAAAPQPTITASITETMRHLDRDGGGIRRSCPSRTNSSATETSSFTSETFHQEWPSPTGSGHRTGDKG